MRPISIVCWDVCGPTVLDDSYIRWLAQHRRSTLREETSPGGGGDWFHMPVTKWSRIYIQRQGMVGEMMLAVGRLHPKRRGDQQWVAVRANRQVQSIDLADRAKFRLARAPGVLYAPFPPLSPAEKRTASDQCKQRQSDNEQKGFGFSWGSLLRWARSAALWVWASASWGTLGAVIFFSWRLAAYFELLGWTWYVIEKAERFHVRVQEWQDVGSYIKDTWEEGMLELPLLIASGLMVAMLLGRRLWRYGGRSVPSTPAGSDVDSEGEAGHECQSDGEAIDEPVEQSAEIDALRGEMAGLRAENRRMSAMWTVGSASEGSASSPPSARDPLATTTAEKMLSRLAEFERTIDIDRAAGAPPASRQRMPEVPPLPGLAVTPRWCTRCEKVFDQRHCGECGSAGAALSITGGAQEPMTPARGGQAEAKTTPASSGSGSWINVTPLKDALQDPRQKLIENLESLDGKVPWALPGGRVARVAPSLLVSVFSK